MPFCTMPLCSSRVRDFLDHLTFLHLRHISLNPVFVALFHCHLSSPYRWPLVLKGTLLGRPQTLEMKHEKGEEGLSPSALLCKMRFPQLHSLLSVASRRLGIYRNDMTIQSTVCLVLGGKGGSWPEVRPKSATPTESEPPEGIPGGRQPPISHDE